MDCALSLFTMLHPFSQIPLRSRVFSKNTASSDRWQQQFLLPREPTTAGGFHVSASIRLFSPVSATATVALEVYTTCAKQELSNLNKSLL